HVERNAERVGPGCAQFLHRGVAALRIPRADADSPAESAQARCDLVSDSFVRTRHQRDRPFTHVVKRGADSGAASKTDWVVGDTARISVVVNAGYDDAVETRELRYFVAVAEELHFGRAAERLAMAQPPLSRAIRDLERQLGVRLFERTTRQVSLTPAGEVLLRDARTALDAVSAAGRRAQQAGRVTPA